MKRISMTRIHMDIRQVICNIRIRICKTRVLLFKYLPPFYYLHLYIYCGYYLLSVRK
jgi:hypothetical protein